MINPHTITGQKISALIESVAGVSTNESIVNDINELISNVLSKTELSNEKKNIIDNSDATQLRVYFVNTASENIDNAMLDQYQEYVMQQSTDRMQLKNISFAKFATLMTILSAFIKDKQSIAEIAPVIKRIVSSSNL